MNSPLSFDLDIIKSSPHAWAPFHEGIQVHWLVQTDNTGYSAALLKYAPGAAAPLHEHRGYEHILVLEGSQQDDNGLHGVGNLSINPPGTAHTVFSEDGCIVLAIWEKPVRFI
uniref:cupin domain-containing protein n=1 Tax=Marinobacterium profundum TaxID=1714300 RepID=UPI00082A538D|nr:cupin domain-containing protein [Marinobacterium profundum]